MPGFQTPSIPASASTYPMRMGGFPHALCFALRYRDEKDCMKLSIEYNGAIFDSSSMRRLLTAFRTLLTGVCADPNQKVSAISLLSDNERRQLLGDLDETPGEPELDTVALQKLRRARRKQVSTLASGKD